MFADFKHRDYPVFYQIMKNNPSLEDNCKKNNRIRINLRINIYLSWPFNR